MPSKKKNATNKKKTARPVTVASGAGGKKRKTAPKKKGSLVPAALPVTTTYLHLLVDESSSMQSVVAAANAALHQWANNIKASSAAATNQRTVTHVTFFNGAHRQPIVGQRIEDLDVGALKIVPSGNTALFNTVKLAAQAALAQLIGNSDSALLVVVTDGEETAHNCPAHDMKLALSALISTGRADVAFMVPPRTKRFVAGLTGLEESCIKEWEATEAGVRDVTKTFGASFGSYYAARNSGVASMRSVGGSFYVDPDDLTKTDMSKLKDISQEVQLLPVTHRDPEAIAPFFQAKLNRPFEKGKVFYELTKSEKLQPYKRILVQDMATGKMFEGNEARSLLGIKFDQQVRVRPGKDKQKRVFIQSTSLNRKLVTGTEVVFWDRA